MVSFDNDYKEVGAIILDTIEEIYAISEMIVKVKEPIEVEYKLVKPKQIVFHLFPFCLK